MPGRERLTSWIRQIRSVALTSDKPSEPDDGNSRPDDVRALEARIEHLEALVQGLQDSVHRESSRHDKRIGELEARIRPAALGKALSDDARARGL